MTVLFAGAALLTVLLGDSARGAVNACPGDPNCGGPCSSDADCNCDTAQQANFCNAQSGAGGSCTPSSGMDPFVCLCNPGYSPPNCASGACCSRDGSCSETGQVICQDGGSYQGDGVSCTNVTCRKACGSATAPECDGACPPGQECVQLSGSNALSVGAPELAVECFCVKAPTPTSTPTATITPTSSPTGTPTVTQTSTQTPGMEGAPCDEVTDCEGGLVCEAGICTQNTSPAPLASERGVFVIVGLLLSVGALAIFRRRGSI